MRFNGIRIAAALSWRSKWLLLDSVFTLLWFTLFVRLMSFQRLSAKWSGKGEVARTNITLEQQLLARQVEWMIAAISRRQPLKITCLMQAAAAKSLLDRRQIPCTLYFGVAPRVADGRAVNAHAWLQCGDRIITGRAEAKNFRAMTWFS